MSAVIDYKPTRPECGCMFDDVIFLVSECYDEHFDIRFIGSILLIFLYLMNKILTHVMNVVLRIAASLTVLLDLISNECV